MWKDYLSFSRQEQKGFVSLILLLLLLITARLVMPWLIQPHSIQVTTDNTLFYEVLPELDENKLSASSNNIPVFDPNQVTHPFLIEIGLNHRIARNWVNYLSKGGTFYNESDVAKIYGMDSALMAILLPRMNIPGHETRIPVQALSRGAIARHYYLVDLNRVPGDVLVQLGWSTSMIDTLRGWLNNYWVPARIESSLLHGWCQDSLLVLKKSLVAKRREIERRVSIILDMNKADTSDWIQLKGIGPVLSKRIVAYRHKLGGFYSPDQLLDVYGISPVLANDLRPYLIVDTFNIRRIDINKATVRELRDHPYLDFYQAIALVEERKRRGKYNSPLELLELPEFNHPSWDKVLPYLAAN